MPVRHLSIDMGSTLIILEMLEIRNESNLRDRSVAEEPELPTMRLGDGQKFVYP